MAHEQITSTDIAPPNWQPPTPNPALKRLEPLVGSWELKGRTLDSQEDNIFGHVVIEWLPGGFFLQQRGEINFMGHVGHSLEILAYDPATDTFPATVYSSMSGTPFAYYWDVQGKEVTHWTEGSKDTGTFSDDGNLLVGGWRAMPGYAESAANTYDATMIRLR